MEEEEEEEGEGCGGGGGGATPCSLPILLTGSWDRLVGSVEGTFPVGRPIVRILACRGSEAGRSASSPPPRLVHGFWVFFFVFVIFFTISVGR